MRVIMLPGRACPASDPIVEPPEAVRAQEAGEEVWAQRHGRGGRGSHCNNSNNTLITLQQLQRHSHQQGFSHSQGDVRIFNTRASNFT